MRMELKTIQEANEYIISLLIDESNSSSELLRHSCVC